MDKTIEQQVNEIRNERSAGVVYTPLSVAEIMRDLMDVKDDDLLYDCCVGGGNLVENTKCNLILCEYEPYQYNVIKEKQPNATIFNDSCFSIDLSEHTITKGILNPPYSSKKSDIPWKEWEFIEHTLDNISGNGKVAALVPKSNFLDKTKKQRVQALSKHRLDAVISMPKDIFYVDGKKAAGTETVIAIFTANTPHASSKVYMAEFDDGYVVEKHKGRNDAGNATNLKNNLIKNVKNKTIISGYSVYKSVKPDDEILYDCWIPTERPTEADFKRKLKDYLVFEFENKIKEVIND